MVGPTTSIIAIFRVLKMHTARHSMTKSINKYIGPDARFLMGVIKNFRFVFLLAVIFGHKVDQRACRCMNVDEAREVGI